MVSTHKMRGFESPLFAVLFLSNFSIPVISNLIARDSRSEYSTSSHDEHEPRSWPSEITTLSLNNFNSVQKRTNDILGDGWSMQMTHAAAFFPIEDAAHSLADFYQYIMDEALRHMMNGHPGYDELALTRGQLALSWWCPQTKIPWSLIYTFASEMLQGTYRGYTREYAIRFTHLRGMAIDVVLQVAPFAIQALRLAHGDTSGTSRVGSSRGN